MQVAIRKYKEADREYCRSLWRELTEWHREIYQDPTIGGENPENHFDKHLTLVGPDNLWVAEYDAKVVGLAGLFARENEAEIEPFIVSKAHRGKGIGKQLLKTMVSEAQKLGVRFLCIKPVARNTQAIKFLHEQGFRTIGEIELFIDFSAYRWKRGPKLFGCQFNY
ncbi:MAG: GNAT family N-acetyltransferase [Candidatus Bathyarchaeia archaeon]